MKTFLLMISHDWNYHGCGSFFGLKKRPEGPSGGRVAKYVMGWAATSTGPKFLL